METARLSKRIWVYLINLLFYLGLGFSIASPVIVAAHLHVLIYLAVAFGISIILSVFFDLFLLSISKGYNLGSAICGVKYVSSNGSVISKRQALIRSIYESIIIFVVFDWIYFLKNRTERGVIDRLSDSFAIDNRI